MTTSSIQVFAKIELASDDTRQGAGRIKGSLIRYGEVASDRPIMFTNGLTWDADGLVLNVQHDRGGTWPDFLPRLRLMALRWTCCCLIRQHRGML